MCLLFERLADILSPVVTSNSTFTVNLVLVPVVATSNKANRESCNVQVLYAHLALQLKYEYNRKQCWAFVTEE